MSRRRFSKYEQEGTLLQAIESVCVDAAILYSERRGKIRVVTAYEMTTTTNVLRGEMSIPIKMQITIPKFRTEAAEAKWWDSHPAAATEIMKRALKSGKARRAVPLKTVTMRLPVPDIISHMGSGSNWPTTRWSF